MLLLLQTRSPPPCHARSPVLHSKGAARRNPLFLALQLSAVPRCMSCLHVLRGLFSLFRFCSSHFIFMVLADWSMLEHSRRAWSRGGGGCGGRRQKPSFNALGLSQSRMSLPGTMTAADALLLFFWAELHLPRFLSRRAPRDGGRCDWNRLVSHGDKRARGVGTRLFFRPKGAH